MKGVLVMGRSDVVTRRRAVAKVRVLPPEVFPISAEDHQQAVTALTQMIEQWWRNQHDVEPSVQQGDGPTQSGGSLGPEVGLDS